ncbi:MAG: DUF2283 domain-containing protein [Chloroflexaceae bacterium]|nr:DUF2283 domain-containing protein [Chloroflexaceae bacterium]
MSDAPNQCRRAASSIVPVVKQTPLQTLWVIYDREADVLYINFTQSHQATDSEMTDDDIIVRYQGNEVIGYTILHVSTRLG